MEFNISSDTVLEFADIMENFISAIPSIIRTETFVTLSTYKGQDNMNTTQLINNLDIYA